MIHSALYHGFFAGGFYARQALLSGLFWVQQTPFELLYCDDIFMARKAEDAELEINLTTWAAGTYELTRVYVSQYGNVSAESESLTITLDADGYLNYSAGQAPQRFDAWAVTGGYVDLLWTYDPTDEDSTPTGFAIDIWDDPDWVEVSRSDYQDSAYISSYRERLGPFSHGVAQTYRIRSYQTIAEVDHFSDNWVEATVTIDAQGPTETVTDVTARIL